jgi:hypothetical protein
MQIIIIMVQIFLIIVRIFRKNFADIHNHMQILIIIMQIIINTVHILIIILQIIINTMQIIMIMLHKRERAQVNTETHKGGRWEE